MPIWESFLPQQYLLNFELKVKNYITDFIDIAVKKWGITLLKLDFLFAPYFDPNLKSELIPHSQVTWLLKYIKKHYPQVQTIACGAPFASSIGIADIIRISKDTALPPSVPVLINRLLYVHRVKMLSLKLLSLDLPTNIKTDPDVRIFKLDNSGLESIWNNLSKDILGVGDNLTKLPNITLNKIKFWLNQ
jgi:hypothetical protein